MTMRVLPGRVPRSARAWTAGSSARGDQQLRADGDLSYVQFQLLARLSEAEGSLTMTELADGVV